VLQQGDLFTKQEQLFSVVEVGASSLLTVDLDVETSTPIPAPMVKSLASNVLDHSRRKKSSSALSSWPPPRPSTAAPVAQLRPARRGASVNCQTACSITAAASRTHPGVKYCCVDGNKR